MGNELLSPKQYDELVIVLHELKQLGYSTMFLSRRLGINSSTFWYYTKGKRNCPVEVLDRLKEFLEHEKNFNNER